MDQKTPKPDYSELIRFLKKPESYPYQLEDVQHIQTHISHVFLAGSFVYKIKKPLDLGFLDYSTLEKRKTLCEKEVELNRRLSDDIYIGVVGFIKQDGRYTFEEEVLESGDIAEYAVKMRRLPEEYFLHQFIEEDSLSRSHLDRVADTLASFYTDQNRNSDLSKWGKIETIKVNTDENFDQTKQFINQTIGQNSFEAIRYFTCQFFRERAELFQQRIEYGRIVDGHGDLHLEHIHITPEKVQIYDCIEFNERFRYGDLAADLAFLAMDLDFNHLWEMERYFVDQMAERLGDDSLLEIIDFYKCYRAYVKGKVKSFQSTEEEVPESEREKAKEKARQYFNLSLRYALLGSEPAVIIFMGRVGTGKSTLANHLANRLGIKSFSSDTVRKSLAGLPLDKRTPASDRPSLYTPDMTSKTYGRLTNSAIREIPKGRHAILDATFSNAERRQELKDELGKQSISYLFIEARASEKTIIGRLEAREEKQDVISDARREDFEMLNSGYSSPDELDEKQIIHVSTDMSLDETIQELYKKMIDHHIEKGSSNR
ncbi:phosphotransferase [Rhodohalobacter sp. SW132]|uniref:bifunctional aminoglycoside phosphotransferase/ATP-binding protein n=1 Tax=Rhodohalobacter sp. SW132 TaxID=2293433 RepID=UPI000E22898E|nr:AAA family ATPase [Rhodohalobacter sp. SW132]REL38735.1 phosphotransferase [Rhodohalobacter sp. SW132]